MPSQASPRSFARRLSKPDASLRSKFGGSTPFEVTLGISLKKGRIDALGFETDAPATIIDWLNRSCALFVGKNQDECEALTLDVFTASLNPSSDVRPLAVFSWNLIQDVIARLPFGDPMSKMIGKISRLHDEFPLGDRKIDEED